MTTTELKARLAALADRLHADMDDKDVAHRLRLLVPGIEQLEATVEGLESKVKAVAEHRANPPPPCEPDQVPQPRPQPPQQPTAPGVVVASATRPRIKK